MRTFLFHSKSSPGSKPHRTRTHDDGTVVTCSCRGYTASASGECVHVKTVRSAFDGGDLSALVEAPSEPTLFPEDAAPAPSRATFDPPKSDPLVGGFIAPMLASSLDEDRSLDDYSGPEWAMEEKYDGHRLIVRVWERLDGGRFVKAWSRAGNERVLPRHLVEAAQRLASGTYDGELYLPGGTATDVTRLDVQSELRLVFFDLLRATVSDMTSFRAHDRRSLLEVACAKLYDPHHGDISVAPQFLPTREGLLAIWTRGGEGAVIKNVNAVYEPGKRPTTWIKFKRFESAKAVITGFLPGKLGPHSIIVARHASGTDVRTKTLNDAWRADFAKRAETYVGRTLVFEHQGRAKKGKFKSAMADHIL